MEWDEMKSEEVHADWHVNESWGRSRGLSNTPNPNYNSTIRKRSMPNRCTANWYSIDKKAAKK